MKFIITYNLMSSIKKKAINYMSKFYMMSIYKYKFHRGQLCELLNRLNTTQ